MDVAARIRISLAVGVVMAGAGSIALADAVEAGSPAPPLEPDLRTVAAGGSSLDVKRSAKKTALRIANKIANRGAGPLELYATDATGACVGGEKPGEPDRDATQGIYADTFPSGSPNGEFDFGEDQVTQTPKVGCFEYHSAPGHNHWHFQDFSQYRLDDVATGEALAGPSRKIGFCILDGARKFPHLDGSPVSPHYPDGNGCAQGDPDTSPGPMGLSVGWADIYTSSTPGQRLDITGVPSGTYCLVSIANPPGGNSDILESDLGNNERRREIEIDLADRKAKFTGVGCPDPTPKR